MRRATSSFSKKPLKSKSDDPPHGLSQSNAADK